MDISAIEDLYEITTLYVEKTSNIIFETKFFEDYALMRPATPVLYHNIRKVSLGDLAVDYEEYVGDRAEVFRHLATGESEFTQETRH